jgi:hypothetical protein
MAAAHALVILEKDQLLAYLAAEGLHFSSNEANIKYFEGLMECSPHLN